MARLWNPCLCVTAVALAIAMEPSAGAQQPPQIGIAAVSLGAGPFTYDTAEQHRLKVSVVARGLVRPFSLALLPNGDALVTERGTRLRLVRNATGAPGRPTTLEPTPIQGLPEMPPFRGGGLQEVAAHPAFATNGQAHRWRCGRAAAGCRVR